MLKNKSVIDEMKRISRFIATIVSIPFGILWIILVPIMCLPDINNWDNYKHVVQNLWHGG